MFVEISAKILAKKNISYSGPDNPNSDARSNLIVGLVMDGFW